MMGTELCASQLFNACNVLFGPNAGVTVDFIRYLQMSGLKAVYRKKALESHPDRAVALACPPSRWKSGSSRSMPPIGSFTITWRIRDGSY